MSETQSHPPTGRLQAFVEESLEGADHAVVASHLTTCARCATEVAELRALFEALAALPELAPAAGFADRVMARVRVRRPAYQRALAWLDQWLDRVLPKTTRGWAVATAMVAMPVLGAGGMVWWILSQPAVTAQALWLYGSGVAGEALASAGQWAWVRITGSGAAASVLSLVDTLAALGRGGLGLLALMFTTLTAGSIYVLYQNLFRPTERRSQHATYVF